MNWERLLHGILTAALAAYAGTATVDNSQLAAQYEALVASYQELLDEAMEACGS